MAERQVVLPYDLLFHDILPRLPVTTLLQFRRVCKAWRNMIDDPRFATIHLNPRFNDGHVSVLLIDALPDVQTHDTFVFRSLEISKDKTCEAFEIGTFSVHKSMERPRFYPFYNGLICFTVLVSSGDDVYAHDVYLCNPFKRETMRLLAPATPAIPSCFWRTANYGLGFDSTTNTYKIVRIYDDVIQDLIGKDSIPQAAKLEIHTVGTKTWRKPKQELPIDFSIPPRYIYTNGFLYWTQSCVFGGDVIVSFDLANEVLYWLPVPHLDIMTYELFNLRGCLGLFDTSRDTFGEVWLLLKEDNKFESSWVIVYNLFATRNIVDLTTVLGMWDDSHMLFSSHNDYVFLYNIKTHQWCRLDVQGGLMSPHRKVEAITTSLILPSHVNMDFDIDGVLMRQLEI